MSLFTDLKEVFTAYAQQIKGLAAADEEIKAELGETVKFVPQILTDSQKEQVKKNIGSVLDDDVIFRLLDCLRNVAWQSKNGAAIVNRLEKCITPDFFKKTSWKKDVDSIVVNGYQSRKDFVNDFGNLSASITIHDNTKVAIACTQRGVLPYRDDVSLQDMEVYPIPVPDNANRITVNVTPSDIRILPSLWHYDPHSFRYVNNTNEKYGDLGSGNVTFDIDRYPLDYPYLCLEFRRSDSANIDIDDFSIIFETVSTEGE